MRVGTSAHAGRGKWLALMIGVIILTVILVVKGPEQAGEFGRELVAWVRELGWWGWAGLGIAIFSTCLAAVVPATPLVVAAGALFGLWGGIALVTCATFSSAAFAFISSRFLFRDSITQLLSRQLAIDRLQRQIAFHGWKAVFIVRLSPVFPFGLVSYAFGLTGISLRHFMIGNTGSLPNMFVYTYSGSLAGELVLAGLGTSASQPPYYWLILALGLIATITIVVFLGRHARTTLKQWEAD